MASIFKRHNGKKYLISFTDANGHRRQITGFESLKKTQDKAKELEAEVKRLREGK